MVNLLEFINLHETAIKGSYPNGELKTNGVKKVFVEPFCDSEDDKKDN